jgi:hypothetical protein
MTGPAAVAHFGLEDEGTERVLSIAGRRYRTYYSERLIRMLIQRKGLARAPLYFPFKETRGRFFLEPLFRAAPGMCGYWRSAAPSATSRNT